MTLDERWIARNKEVMTFIEQNYRNPSKYHNDECL